MTQIDDWAALLEQRRALGRKPLIAGQHRLSYGELFELGDRVPALLERHAAGSRGHVVIASRSAAAMAVFFTAALRFDMTLVIVDPDATGRERKAVADVIRPLLAVVDDAQAESAGADFGAPVLRVGDDAAGPSGLLGRLMGRTKEPAGSLSFRPALMACDPVRGAVAPDPEGTGLILFTSGTTSRPKGVELSRRALMAQLSTFVRHYGYDPATRILNPVPMHHTDGLMQGPAVALACGGTVLRMGGFRMQDLPELMHIVARERATHLIAVPTLLSLMLRLGPEYDDTFRTPDFRFIRSSAGYLDRPTWTATEERFGVEVVNAYGLTEAVCESIYCGPGAPTRRVGTIGKPVDVDVRILDQDGAALSPGETGELAIGGPSVMTGYFGMPDETAAVLRDGWLLTGDLAEIDGDGFVTLRGRKKNLVIRGGININPQEVAEIVMSLPGVVDAVALGVPDPVWGESLVCCVTRAEGAGLTADAVIAHCRTSLSPEKIPNAVQFVAKMPRGPAGKVILNDLRAMVAEAGKAGPASGGLDGVVIAAAAQAFNVPAESLGADTSPETTKGWDSFAHLAFLQSLEDQLGVRFTTQEMLRVETLGDVVEILARRRIRAPA